MAGSGRSASEKEKTKMRERQRRSITTKIFHGLRKHGGYSLPPRADINEVLRELAREAGWVIEPDGTTYRSPNNNKSGYEICPLCGGAGGKRSGTPTPTSSIAAVGGGGGGESSTTGSPRWISVGESSATGLVGEPGPGPVPSYHLCPNAPSNEIPVSFYFNMHGGLAGRLHQSTTVSGRPSMAVMPYHQQQQQMTLMEEARASNQNTPVGSPQQHRA
ncbi:BES1/BZR1 plant transcription factor, N-terminal [Dillenia turbinata]|uniref:Protein BZR1 homolog n=1 Tax=Dillenia turbinata TaxID=194707 RepID=A0AAN8VEK2_9MAGN